MSADPSSLWPSGIKGKVQSPRALLKIQAEALARQTNGLLHGEIRQKIEGEDKEILSLEIIVPSLDRYRQRILNVAYRKDLPYPCVFDAEYYKHSLAYDYFLETGGFRTDSENVTDNDSEFLAILGKILQSRQVVSAAQSLLARAGDDEGNAAEG